jgi:hypothetical protein
MEECMDTLDAVPNPVEDLKHAQAMLARMDPHELLCATYAMEDILDGAVYVTHDMPVEDEDISAEEAESAARGRADLAAGRFCTLEEMAQELGIPFTPVDQTPAVASGEQ